jgi:transcriptional regulator with XRE-family HTH domain
MSDDVDILVGRQLRRRRRLMGLTQQQLADAIGVRFQQIHKYECAGNRLSVAMLWKLACALDVEVGYFFSGAQRPAEMRAPAKPSLDRPFDLQDRAA